MAQHIGIGRGGPRKDKLALKRLRSLVESIRAEAEGVVIPYRYTIPRSDEERGKLLAYRSILKLIAKYEEEETDDGPHL
jgi:hypothetical protein